MKNVLLEGGGSLVWEFARYIDEFHVTLTPWLAGGSEAPTLMDGPGFRSGEFLGLALVEVRQEGMRFSCATPGSRSDASLSGGVERVPQQSSCLLHTLVD